MLAAVHKQLRKASADDQSQRLGFIRGHWPLLFQRVIAGLHARGELPAAYWNDVQAQLPQGQAVRVADGHPEVGGQGVQGQEEPERRAELEQVLRLRVLPWVLGPPEPVQGGHQVLRALRLRLQRRLPRC